MSYSWVLFLVEKKLLLSTGDEVGMEGLVGMAMKKNIVISKIDKELM
jgi:hypothetical protein